MTNTSTSTQTMTRTSVSSQHNRSFGLDFARALAISLVLVAHFVKKYESTGFWGVELFFGLSGFLIGQILWRNYEQAKNWSFKYVVNFWSRRWWRTLPNYYLFLIIMLVFHYYNGGFPSLFLFFKHLWFGQDLIHRDGTFFGVAWSLCIEEWFYLLFPIILFLINKLGFKHKTAFIISLLIIFINCAIVREILIGQHVGHSLRGITLARLDAIGCGVAVAFWLSVTKITAVKRWVTFFMGIAMLLGAFYIVYFSGLTYNQIKESRYLLVSVPMGFALTLPLMSVVPTPKGIFTFFAISVEKMSFWTYSLYLSHIPVLFTVYYLFGNLRSGILSNTLSKIIGVIITIAVSAVIFKYYESPITRKRPRELN
jgi:peptidoglycan/LPS O-acetylase OafA/YrhL